MLSNLFSHPDKRLEEHVNGCLEHFRKEISRLNLSDDKLIKAIEILIVCHDIGKATKYFQDYIKEHKKSHYSNHSLLSSVFAFYVTKDVLNDPRLAVYNFVACKNHHSDLWNSKEENINFFDEELSIVSKSISPDPQLHDAIDYLKKQLDSIDFSEFYRFVSNLNVCDDIKSALMVSKQQVEEWIEKIEEELMRIRYMVLNQNLNNSVATDSRIYGSIEDYFTFLLMFSSLVYSDKKDAILPIGFEFSSTYLEVDEAIVEKYKKTLKTDYSINTYREQAYKEVLGNDVQELIESGKRFFSITLPTGMGKTLTGLAFALKLRSFLKKNGKGEYKIIYSLPFLSIIDQNFNVIERILEENGILPTSDIIVKHHYLSELRYRVKSGSSKISKDDYLDIEISKLFIETWETNIVVTTFIQLFLSIITNSNSSSRRFIRLAKSIIILDEVQTIPYKYWTVVREFFEKYAEKFDVYLVFMTATQPKIIPTFELVRNKDFYFKALDRIEVQYDPRERTVDEFVESYSHEIRKHLEDGKRVLFICNTIDSSKKLYGKILEKFHDYSITYLSSYVIPKHRLERIKEIRDGKYRILVSTQVVEAGVDIDFDVVYRDFAPIDSIIQSSGRCNRNATKGKGTLKVVYLVYENDKNKRDAKSKHPPKQTVDRKWYASQIYDYLLLDCTRNVFNKYFSERNCIGESDFVVMVDDYFREVDIKKDPGEARRILDAIGTLNFNKVSSFKLIEEEVYKSDVFIEYDDEAVEIWKRVGDIYNKVMNASKKSDFFEARREYLEIKAKLHQYVLSADIRKLNIPEGYFGMYYVPKNAVSNFYDPVEGFRTKVTSFEIIRRP